MKNHMFDFRSLDDEAEKQKLFFIYKQKLYLALTVGKLFFRAIFAINLLERKQLRQTMWAD